MSGTDLYRFYDDEGLLLYVGISTSAIARWAQHQGDKAWWPEVVTTKVEHFATRAEARVAELVAIRTERPRYNIADGGRAPGSRVTWASEDGSERCLSVRHKDHGYTLTNARRTAQGSSWRCVLPAGHDGLHRARASARQAPWGDADWLGEVF